MASDLSYIYIFYTLKNGPWGEVDGELPGEWEKVGGERVEVCPPTPQNCLSCPKSCVCNTGSQVLLVKEEDSAVFLQQIQRRHAAGALFPGQCCFFLVLAFPACFPSDRINNKAYGAAQSSHRVLGLISRLAPPSCWVLTVINNSSLRGKYFGGALKQKLP